MLAGPASVGWFKSSYSAAQNECVEAAFLGRFVGLRDSKTENGAVLMVRAETFAHFVATVKADNV
ncbi:DUF397 domain-containing protein [Streptomyces daliensis]|uniref:DUF397 domain-containing protein n=1 Tax=Streptomyces daliensis TaxID=299421 RepID=A0A8T4IKL3_9ACTN|nr:DUF397 domain-containing protein [Streptomyces daliensis]